MGNGPAQGNIKVKQLRQRVGGLLGVGVSPGLEGCQQVSVAVKSHIAMHHGADADGSGICQYHVIFFFDCLLETAVAALQSLMDLSEGISPDAVLQRVLPVVYTDGQYLAFPVDENRFDTG